MIVSDQLVTALATSALPSFAVLIGILINNQRLNDFSRSIDVRFNDIDRHISDSKDILRAEMFRMEQVIDARLKHLEEHLR